LQSTVEAPGGDRFLPRDQRCKTSVIHLLPHPGDVTGEIYFAHGAVPQVAQILAQSLTARAK
jgi:hypothetical protein